MTVECAARPRHTYHRTARRIGLVGLALIPLAAAACSPSWGEGEWASIAMGVSSIDSVSAFRFMVTEPTSMDEFYNSGFVAARDAADGTVSARATTGVAANTEILVEVVAYDSSHGVLANGQALVRSGAVRTTTTVDLVVVVP